MNWRTGAILLSCFVGLAFGAEGSGSLFTELFRTITDALIASGANGPKRQPVYPPDSNGISASVYTALQTIARNDELECVPRLLCEAIAGGNPGGSRQINIDKYSLTKLISYLQLDPSNTSPMLTFGKAAVLGLSNRGDPYSCIINYPKCPKDEARLLYYLNNHRGGFFRFFDMKVPHLNYQYGQSSYYSQYPSNTHQTYKPTQYYSREPGNHLFKSKEGNKYAGTYAKNYGHTKVAFPGRVNDVPNGDDAKRVIFPSGAHSGEPRIQTKAVPGYEYSTARPDRFVFSSTQRYGKGLSTFFPSHPNTVSRPTSFVSDRLPSKFHFPAGGDGYYGKHPSGLQKGFFPRN